MDAYSVDAKELLEDCIPKNLDKYDVIGFDVDHCLAQYNVPELFAMTYRAVTGILVKELSYPASIQLVNADMMNFSMKGLVCDKKTGCLLKLGENGLVLRAYYGFSQLSQSEVLSITSYYRWKRYMGPHQPWPNLRALTWAKITSPS